MPRIPEKAVEVLATTGFAAAGVVSVVAQNLRTLADRDEPLTDRAKQVAQNSLGAVLGGPAALTDRGRQLVGRDGGSNGHDTDAAKVTAKTVAPEERPDRSKAKEARDRQLTEDADQRVTAEKSDEPAAKHSEAKKAAGKTSEKPKKTEAKKTKAKQAEAKADAKTTEQPKKTEAKKTEKKQPAQKKQAEPAKSETPESGTADPTRSVEEQRAAQKTAKKKEQAKKSAKSGKGGSNGSDEPERPEGLPKEVDDQLVSDLQRMSVKQLRDRAAQDGIPNRTNMSKDELVVALAKRETDDVPAKA